MNYSRLNWITNFIWGIAGDLLRNLYVDTGKLDVHEAEA
ncbi:Type I restriction-modification system, DNA-methyltransferase subunit M [hydrothermal vent metagenome]|uniref:Type I restriction-modification system, DNA-methyltransferase subunit M n=1 Tax=hydrothermal vent metagenome TaxID=652676 RepID=A0A3B1B4E2_9ZZZZ